MLNYRYYTLIRNITRILGCFIVLAILAQALRFTFSSDTQSQLRSFDQLFIQEQYYQALQFVRTSPTPYEPVIWARKGMLHSLRNEPSLANQSFAVALRSGLSGLEYDLLRLYQGYNSWKRGYQDEARNAWDQIDRRSALTGLRLVLEAEVSLNQQDFVRAERELRQALTYPLPVDWFRFTHQRLALLRASSDLVSALNELQLSESKPTEPASGHYFQLAQALLPHSSLTSTQLRNILEAPAEQRAQLLGQTYLELAWYPLAELQFAAIPESSPLWFSAVSYLAYTQWQIGASDESISQLSKLMESYPEDPRPRALLALIQLSASQEDEARIQLNLVRTMAPYEPDTFLAWAQWHSVKREYTQAAQAYENARTRAAPAERLKYSIAQIRFHLNTNTSVCSTALQVAEEAATLEQQNSDVWTLLAQVQLACKQTQQALYSSQQALRLNNKHAEAYFYQGEALISLKQRDAARASLIQAANLAPSSIWRNRAEELLQQLD